MAYSLCILVLFALVSQAISQEGCNFKCVKGSETDFKVGDLTFSCSGSYVCNKFNANYDCKPCISYTNKCKDFYKCISYKPNKVIIGGTQVNCPDQYKCNSMAKGDCDPCLHQGCGSQVNFECDPAFETTVIIQNVVVDCKDGTVCNKYKQAPCYPCIDKDKVSPVGAYYLN